MNPPSTRTVECRSDFDYPGRPTAVYWKGSRIAVSRVLNACRTDRGKNYRILCENEQVYICTYLEAVDIWEIFEQ